MEKTARTQSLVHELILRRRSPRAFSGRPVERDKLRSLFEAARWAPSSYNAQPWFFLVATKEDPAEFDRMLHCLVDGNIAWAKDAGVLMLSVAKLHFDHNGKLNRHAFHDVGLAAENLVLQTTAMGLAAHQMAGIHIEKAREEFGIPEGYEAVAGIAVGYPGVPEQLPEKLREREIEPRNRKPLESFVFTGYWGRTAPQVKNQE